MQPHSTPRPADDSPSQQKNEKSTKGPLRTSAKCHCVGLPLCSGDVIVGRWKNVPRTFGKGPLDVLYYYNNVLLLLLL